MLRVYLAGGAVVLALLGLLYVRHLQGEVREAKARAEAAQTQAQITDAVAQSVDRYATTSKTLKRKADDAAETVRKAPGSDDRFEPSAELCAALAGMRDGEPVCVADDPASVP